MGELTMGKRSKKELKREIRRLRANLDDAVCVIVGLGYNRSRCPACKRMTVTQGYVCWNCGCDPTMDDDDDA
jgi:hypothetical protein